MPRHLLTDRNVRNAKPRAKSYRLADGDGLYLFVPPSGACAWQYRYRHDGKPQTGTLGKASVMSLAEARAAAQQARKVAADGTHVTVAKRVARARKRTASANTFVSVAADWVKEESRRAGWSVAYKREVEASLRNHLSDLDALPMAEITAPVAAPILRAVEKTAPLMVEKVRRRLRAIFDYAVVQGVIVGNPLPALRGPKVNRHHFPSITELARVGEILRAARAADPAKGIARAHLLVAFTAQRIAEVVGAQWAEFELDGVDVPVGSTAARGLRFDASAGNWTIPRARMKVKKEDRGPHVVPIPPRLLAELKEWREADRPDATLVCPAPRDASKPVTPEGVEKHYREALGLVGKHSPHSWRSTFKTICAEAGKDSEVIEAHLDHVVGNKTASSYDRAKRLELRRALLKWYEGVLIAARDGGEVLELTRRLSASPTAPLR